MGSLKHLFTPLLTVTLAGPLLAAGKCETVASMALPHTAILSASEVPAGQFVPPAGPGQRANAFAKLPAFCRVAAALKPTADSDIRIEVWLPASGWNGKLQSVGNGAWAGSISYPALAAAVTAGYAAASTDTGHTGNNAAFIPGHPEKLADFVYRSVHEMTVAAKGLIEGFYGQAPKYSYWNGCSTGGRQGLTEAQRYPDDYDGIIAGAPAAYVTRLQGMQVWTAQQANRDAGSLIPKDKFSMLHNAALAACDGLDGVKDGVMEDPTKCHFDPQVVACKNGDGSNCLTAEQVETARHMYAGPRLNGKSIYWGIEPGSEMGFDMIGGSKPMSFAEEIYKYAAFDGNWNAADFKLEDIARFEKEKGKVMDSFDPNLNAFFSHNGKLLMYHGWSDPGVPPLGTVNYFNRVTKTVGAAKAEDNMRLFMVPGMGHCRGGDGTDDFDMIKAMERWAEDGKGPSSIPASRMREGKVDRTRPLCAYPTKAVYKGSGSTDEAANFSCQ